MPYSMNRTGIKVTIDLAHAAECATGVLHLELTRV
jgi:hypothetical protein